jgi:hypothetical protein
MEKVVLPNLTRIQNFENDKRYKNVPSKTARLVEPLGLEILDTDSEGLLCAQGSECLK